MATVEVAVKDFLSHCQNEKKLSEKTLKAYRIDLKQFLEFLENSGKNPDIREIGKELIRDFLDVIQGNNKPKTVKRKVATMRAFFNYLEFEDRIVVSPFRKMTVKIKEEKTEPKNVGLAEIRKIMQEAYKVRESSKNRSIHALKTSIRDVAILELLLATGMRVSELCTLKKKGVDLDEQKLHIEGEGTRERTIPLCGPEVLEAVGNYLAVFDLDLMQGEYLFLNRNAGPLSDQSVRFLVKKYAKECGLEQDVTPHTFRHTVATLLLESGMDIRYIQHFLGHSSITTTQVYVGVNEDVQTQILQERHPRMRLNPIQDLN